jgi:hypothetical protein
MTASKRTRACPSHRNLERMPRSQVDSNHKHVHHLSQSSLWTASTNSTTKKVSRVWHAALVQLQLKFVTVVNNITELWEYNTSHGDKIVYLRVQYPFLSVCFFKDNSLSFSINHSFIHSIRGISCNSPKTFSKAKSPDSKILCFLFQLPVPYLSLRYIDHSAAAYVFFPSSCPFYPSLYLLFKNVC